MDELTAKTYPSAFSYVGQETREWKFYGLMTGAVAAFHLLAQFVMILIFSRGVLMNPMDIWPLGEETLFNPKTQALLWKLPLAATAMVILTVLFSAAVAGSLSKYTRFRMIDFTDFGVVFPRWLRSMGVWWLKICATLLASCLVPWLGFGIWLFWVIGIHWTATVAPLSEMYSMDSAAKDVREWSRKHRALALQFGLLRAVGLFLCSAYFWMPFGVIAGAIGGAICVLVTGAFQRHFNEYRNDERLESGGLLERMGL